MTTHFGWARQGKSWKLVATGASEAEAYRELLAWVKARPASPVASAVLPAGVHPAAQDGAGSLPAGPDDPRRRQNRSGLRVRGLLCGAVTGGTSGDTEELAEGKS